MRKYNGLDEAQLVYNAFKEAYKEVGIVGNRKRTCANCGKSTKKYYELRLRMVRRTRLTNKGYLSNNYIGKIYVGRSKKMFKHLAWVCSKPCEVMFALKLI